MCLNFVEIKASISRFVDLISGSEFLSVINNKSTNQMAAAVNCKTIYTREPDEGIKSCAVISPSVKLDLDSRSCRS